MSIDTTFVNALWLVVPGSLQEQKVNNINMLINVLSFIKITGNF